MMVLLRWQTILKAFPGKGQSNVSTIRSLAVVIKTMLDNPYTAHEYKNSYYTQYCSLSSLVFRNDEYAA